MTKEEIEQAAESYLMDNKHHPFSKIRDAFKAGIQYSESENERMKAEREWISVEDRLPETNCDVLTVKKNGRVIFMSFHAPFDSGKRIFQWWGFGAWVDQHRQVTHWMPLPQPPKQ